MQRQQQQKKQERHLDKYSQDLTASADAGKLDPVIGRDEEIRRLVQILSRRRKNNPVLVGEPGVGKTAIVEGLASRIIRGDIPDTLQNVKVHSLDLGALIAGAVHRGEFEDRLKQVLKEVGEANGKIVLFIDEIHMVLGAGAAGGSMDAANLLKPMLARGELRCIGATTLEEYQKHVEKDPAFERRFQKVLVREPSVEATVSVLRGLKERYESHHGVRVQDASLVAAARLADRYISNRFLPDKAIDLLDEACASIRVQLDSQPEEIDALERRELQLDVEATALKAEKNKDKGTEQKFTQVLKDLAKVRENLEPLKAQYEQERRRVHVIRDLKKKLETLNSKVEAAERRRDLEQVADLRFGAIPEVQNLLNKAEEELKVYNEANSDDRFLSEDVTPEHICEVVARSTGIPVQKLGQSQAERLLNLDQVLHRRVVGQDDAVTAVAEAVIRSRAGLGRPSQPVGSFLFLGPTGVGKTELAKALAAELFDDDRNIVRLDMSEYLEEHSVARLVGAPPGYVGYEQGGQLTEAVRTQPYCVVLLDEVEKAHPNVFNTLLQVLDDGRLTDGKGRVVDFSNTLIIMTSNLGAEHLLRAAGKGAVAMQKARDSVLTATRSHFKPEFLNRLDDLIIFSSLGTEHLAEIVRHQLKDVQKRLDDRQIKLQLSDAACALVLRDSYHPAYGARPMRRYLEKHIATALSRYIIKGLLPNGSTVKVKTSDGKLKFAIVRKAPSEDEHDTEMKTRPEKAARPAC